MISCVFNGQEIIQHLQWITLTKEIDESMKVEEDDMCKGLEDCKIELRRVPIFMERFSQPCVALAALESLEVGEIACH